MPITALRETMAVRGVLKIGGSVVGQSPLPVWVQELQQRLEANDQVLVVHGGGSLISDELDRRGEPVEFVEGQRVTSDQALAVVLAVLKGQVNGRLVAFLATHGIPAVGVSGIDLGLLTSETVSPRLGRVGQVTAVDPRLIEGIWQMKALPVVAPLAGDGAGGILNLNGDVAAGALAGAIGADYLVFYTDSGGVREVASDPASLRSGVSRQQALSWISDGTVSKGMIPKLKAGFSALDAGVKRVVIGGYAPGQGTDLLA